MVGIQGILSFQTARLTAGSFLFHGEMVPFYFTMIPFYFTARRFLSIHVRQAVLMAGLERQLCMISDEIEEPPLSFPSEAS